MVRLAIKDLTSKGTSQESINKKKSALIFLKASNIIDFLGLDRQYLLDKYCKKST